MVAHRGPAIRQAEDGPAPHGNHVEPASVDAGEDNPTAGRRHRIPPDVDLHEGAEQRRCVRQAGVGHVERHQATQLWPSETSRSVRPGEGGRCSPASHHQPPITLPKRRTKPASTRCRRSPVRRRAAQAPRRWALRGVALGCTVAARCPGQRRCRGWSCSAAEVVDDRERRAGVLAAASRFVPPLERRRRLVLATRCANPDSMPSASSSTSGAVS